MLILRLSAALFLLAWLGVVIPTQWMKTMHEIGNTGPWVESPMFLYLARSVSALYGFYGVVTWFLARDVNRYLPLIRFLAWAGLPMAVVLVAIGYTAGLPAWWYITEGVAVVVISLAWVWAARSITVTNVP